MALVLADRVKETTTTTGTATYTLAGASTGFESFASIGDGNTTYYACTDGTDFEVGIGTYTASGTTLARTTILQSSNSDAAVSWSSGSKTIFCCQPAEKAVFLDASGNIATFDGSNLTNVNAQTLDSLDSTQFLRSDAADTKTSGNLNFSDNVQAKFGDGGDLSIFHDGTNSRIYGTTGDTNIGQNAFGAVKLTGDNDQENMLVATVNGSVELYHDNSKKIETTATGAEITGDLTLTSTDGGASENPTLDLYRNSASPADNDVLGHITFTGENSAGEKVQYAEIEARNTDVTDGTEDGRINFNALVNGANTLHYSTAFGLNIFHRDVFLNTGINILFEGGTADAHELTLTSADVTADRTITLPDATGTVPVFTTAPTSAITDGTNGQVLTTNGSGGLSFADAVGGGGGSGISAGKSIIFSMVFG